MQSYDAIVIGGGHNGIFVHAAYLARAGLKVVVLEERRHVVGGATVTEELHPGFKFLTGSYLISLLRPEVIRRARRLPKHGLEIMPLESTFVPLPNGDYLADWPRPRQDARRDRAPQREGRGRIRRVRDDDAQARARGEAAARHGPAGSVVERAARSRGDRRDRRPPPRPAARRLRSAHAPLDDERGRLPRRVVRGRRAQGHEVHERHHRHLPRPALARHGLRAPAPLHRRDRRRAPRVGLLARRHRRAQPGDRVERARRRRRGAHRVARRARAREGRPRRRRRARERRRDLRAARRLERRREDHVPEARRRGAPARRVPCPTCAASRRGAPRAR